RLELHHDRVPHAGFVLPQVGAETRAARYTREARCGREEWAWYERSVSHHRSGTWVRNRAGIAVDSRSDSAATGPVRHVRMAVSILRSERDVLFGHPVERDRTIPGFVRITGVLREIGRAADGVSAVDWWK